MLQSDPAWISRKNWTVDARLRYNGLAIALAACLWPWRLDPSAGDLEMSTSPIQNCSSCLKSAFGRGWKTWGGVCILFAAQAMLVSPAKASCGHYVVVGGGGHSKISQHDATMQLAMHDPAGVPGRHVLGDRPAPPAQGTPECHGANCQALPPSNFPASKASVSQGEQAACLPGSADAGSGVCRPWHGAALPRATENYRQAIEHPPRYLYLGSD